MLHLLFRRRKSRQFEVPNGRRVYAVGDIHGRHDLLEQLLRQIAADDAGRAPAETLIVFLGDLVDRGPDSAHVVRTVRTLCEQGRATLLKGNHEEVMIKAARGDAAAARGFMKIGGMATLMSYGISEQEANEGTFQELTDLIRSRIPAEDVEFLDDARDYVRIGDYLFVHAGIRPGVTLEAQNSRDLRWVREAFTSSQRDHGAMIVHGHTITDQVDIQHNRIGLDTGAFASGRLSALGLEGQDSWILQTEGETAETSLLATR